MKRIIKIVCLILSMSVVINGFSMDFAARRIKANEFPNKTIIIGTHAIYLDVINEQLINLAEKSKSYTLNGQAKEQNGVYYKSELNNGTWFDITSTSSIDDVINNPQKVVSDKFIDSLPIKYYTNEDVKTIEFSSGEEIQPHNINDLAYPENMGEDMTSVNIRIKTLESAIKSVKGKSKKAKKERSTLSDEKSILDSSFTKVDSSKLSDLKSKLGVFSSFLKYAKNDAKLNDDYIKVISDIIFNFQSKYDAECYSLQIAQLTRLSNAYDNPVKYDASIKSIFKAINAVNESKATVEGNIKTSPAYNTLSKYREQAIDSIESLVYKKSFKKAINWLDMIISIDRIQSKHIIDKNSELKVLKLAKNDIKLEILKIAKAGDSNEYKRANSKNEQALLAKKILKSLIRNLKDKVEDAAFIKDSTLKRLDDPDKKIVIIKELKEYLITAKNSCKNADATYYDYVEILNTEISKLDAQLAEISVSENEQIQSQKSEIDDIKNNIRNLKDAYLTAADKDDVELMENIEKSIQSLENDLTSVQNSMRTEYGNLLQKNAKGELSDDDKTKLHGLKNMMSDLDKQKINSVDTSYKNALNAIKKEDASALSESLRTLKEDIDNAGDLFSDNYFDNLKAKVYEDYKNKFISLLNEGDYSKASLLAKSMGSSEDIKSAEDKSKNKVKTDMGGNKLLAKLLNKSQIFSELDMNINKINSEIADVEKDIDDIKNAGYENGKNNELDVLMNRYSDLLKELHIVQKQKIIVNILVHDMLLNGKYAGDDVLENEMNGLVNKLIILDSVKYSADSYNMIAKNEKHIVDLTGYKTIPVTSFVVESASVPLLYPVLNIDGVYYIPGATLASSFSSEVIWDANRYTTIIKRGKDVYELLIGSNSFMLNSQIKTMDDKFMLLADKTYLPIKFITQQLHFGNILLLNDDVIILYSKDSKNYAEKILGGQ